MTCGICQDDITDHTAISECGHTFCFDCIVKWANTSNTCPICQRRFLQLVRSHASANKKGARGARTVNVKHVDHREENALRVMEEFDSEECSIHTGDDDSDELSLGSEGDYLEE